MAIEGIEKASLTWRAYTDWALAEIEKARDQLEFLGALADDTAFLRSRISTLRETIALTDPPRPLTTEAVAFDAR